MPPPVADKNNPNEGKGVHVVINIKDISDIPKDNAYAKDKSNDIESFCNNELSCDSNCSIGKVFTLND